MKRVIALMLGIAIVLMFVGIYAQDSGKEFKYVGLKKCKMCHKSKKSGNQFGLWQERAHSKAYETLASEQSKQVAKEVGVTGDPQKAAECLECHVTAYKAAAELKESTLTMEEGVSCEACHGPGSEYKSMKTMKALYAGEIKGETVGLIEPTNEVCVTCHNEKSPTYKEFVYEEAVKKIAHPVPEK